MTHFVQFNMPACMLGDTAAPLPAGHHASSEWADVTCVACLEKKNDITTYTISADRKTITCRACGRTSHSAGDIKHRYCPVCNIYHDLIWPPARQAWVEHRQRQIHTPPQPPFT